jgi:hypothetical protein
VAEHLLSQVQSSQFKLQYKKEARRKKGKKEGRKIAQHQNSPPSYI